MDRERPRVTPVPNVPPGVTFHRIGYQAKCFLEKSLFLRNVEVVLLFKDCANVVCDEWLDVVLEFTIRIFHREVAQHESTIKESLFLML